MKVVAKTLWVFVLFTLFTAFARNPFEFGESISEFPKASIQQVTTPQSTVYQNNKTLENSQNSNTKEDIKISTFGLKEERPLKNHSLQTPSQNSQAKSWIIVEKNKTATSTGEKKNTTKSAHPLRKSKRKIKRKHTNPFKFLKYLGYFKEESQQTGWFRYRRSLIKLRIGHHFYGWKLTKLTKDYALFKRGRRYKRINFFED